MATFTMRLIVHFTSRESCGLPETTAGKTFAGEALRPFDLLADLLDASTAVPTLAVGLIVHLVRKSAERASRYALKVIDTATALAMRLIMHFTCRKSCGLSNAATDKASAGQALRALDLLADLLDASTAVTALAVGLIVHFVC
jgi:hypothetical protein